jgi:hypothetical protein
MRVAPMQHLRDSIKARLTSRRGVALPTVIFSTVITTTIAVVALSTSFDEQRSSQAVRGSLQAFYAAETGLNAVQVTWNDTTATLDSIADALQSGGKLDLGWNTLSDGSSYRAEVMRLNNAGSQDVFLVSVVGRDATGFGGERALSLLVNRTPGELTFGGCCTSAAMIRGEVTVNTNTGISGTDTDPPSWSGGVCDQYDQKNQPGLTNDAPGLSDFNIRGNGFVSSGDSITSDESYRPIPAVVQDNNMDDTTFDRYGTKSWQDVKDVATTVIGNGPGKQVVLEWGGDPATDNSKFGPRYHDLSDGHGHGIGDPILGSCDYGHPLNFGAPSGPCHDHFPVILVQGEVEIKDQGYDDYPDDESQWDVWYMQGIVIMDTLSDGQGSEFELESPGTFAGLMIGKGCIQLQDGSQTHGAIFVDGSIQQQTCENPPLELNQGDNVNYPNTDLYYSECVVQEVLKATGMGEASMKGGGGARKFPSRSFAEILR